MKSPVTGCTTSNAFTSTRPRHMMHTSLTPNARFTKYQFASTHGPYPCEPFLKNSCCAASVDRSMTFSQPTTSRSTRHMTPNSDRRLSEFAAREFHLYASCTEEHACSSGERIELPNINAWTTMWRILSSSLVWPSSHHGLRSSGSHFISSWFRNMLR